MKKFSFFTISFFLIIVVGVGSNFFVNIKNDLNGSLLFDKWKKIEENIINSIGNKYSSYVKTNSDIVLYKMVDSRLIEYGILGEGNEIELEEQEITSGTRFFKIKDSDFYISYDNLEKIDELSLYDDRYKNYIEFSENIITKNPTVFEDEKGVKIIINQSISIPIIIKYNSKYGVEYNNKLYFINKDNVERIEDNNLGSESASRVRTLTYHFLYDSSEESCNQELCVSLDVLETHLKYLKDNDYFTLTLPELEMFIDGKINIPKKSIVLTVDDGTIFNKKVIDLINKYETNMTLFAITSWCWQKREYRNESIYFDIESHTDNMHITYECPGYGNQGGAIMCKDREYILNDLKKSQEALDGSVYFAYPFYDYNNRAIELLKEAGFHMAFAGDQGTGGYSYRNTNKFLVPRMAIFYNCNLDVFANLVAV